MAEQKGSFSGSLAAFTAGTIAGLEIAAEDIMREARVLCPKDTETLVRSAFIEPPEVSGDRLVCRIGFGRGEAINPKTNEHPSKYAVPVHERLEVRHDPPTTAKFLELPCVAYEPEFGPKLRVWISRFVKGEGTATDVSSAGLIGSVERIT